MQTGTGLFAFYPAYSGIASLAAGTKKPGTVGNYPPQPHTRTGKSAILVAFMNYLAHAVFSFGQPGLLVGNMISDFVKGRQQYSYPPAIYAGIKLHRLIDAYTDGHPANQAARALFRPHYRLYAASVVDVVYDYFVANDAALFADTDALSRFAQATYTTLHQHEVLLPHGFARMLPFMERQNWLLNYRYTWGIGRSLEGLVHRSRHLTDAQMAFTLFEQHQGLLQDCYQQYRPALQQLLHRWWQAYSASGQPPEPTALLTT